MENLNEQYNKKILIQPIDHENITNNLSNNNNTTNNNFDLCFLTYHGKITFIFDKFNKLPINTSKSIVSNSFTVYKKRNCLQLASFLNFPNIFLYLLTYDADQNYLDENHQNTWHFICYKGHWKILNILLNFITFKIKSKYLNLIDLTKKNFNFSKLDINKGKLSKAIHITNEILKNFNEFQKKIIEICENMIKEFFNEMKNGLLIKDKEGQTPFHLNAMSKFSLCQKVLNEILDFDFFNLKKENFEEFLKLFFEIQKLEVKKERLNNDPRKIFRLEKEINFLLGENFINDLKKKFNIEKKNFFKDLINTQDNNGNSILHISSFFGDFHIVKKLLLNGGKKFEINDLGQIPIDLAKNNFIRKKLTNLNKAAKNSDQKNINELVNFGENINEKISIFNQAPIHKIIESKKENKHFVLKNMLIMGSDPNLKDMNGWSPLHYACKVGDLESVKILIEFGAEINNFSNNRKIALHFACENNFPEIVFFLCENGSEINFKDDFGCCPIHFCAKYGNTKCLEILLKFNCDFYVKDFRNWNILHYASFYGQKKTIKFIVNFDADYDILKNEKNSNNKIPIEIVKEPEMKKFFFSLFHAAKNGDLDLTKNLIINENENINKLTKFEKNSSLILATFNSHFLEVKFLIEKNADVNIKNKDEMNVNEIAEKIYEKISEIYLNCNDLEREKIDLRNVIKKFLNDKNEKKINSLICKKNWNVRIWKIFDFSLKICKLLGIDVNEDVVNIKKEKEKEKNKRNKRRKSTKKSINNKDENENENED